METLNIEYKDAFDGNKSKNIIFSKELLEKNCNEKSLFALRVDGESMQPLIKHKALIIADLSQKQLVDEAIYLLYYDNQMWVKKYDIKKDIFISINPKFSHLIYKQKDIHLVAKVVLTFTNL